MTRLRKLQPTVQKRDAMGPNQWLQLLRKAIARAQATKDPRLNGLQQAMATSSAEKILRRMSIICDADLIREFPESQT